MRAPLRPVFSPACRSLLFAALLVAAPARGADVVVFGDSWAEGAADELADTLAARAAGDITVAGYGVGGTTAELWAGQPNALPDAVSLNPDARWVWLSLGGNDVFGHYAAGNGANAAADNDRNIRAVLDALFARHPGVKVVFFGYDFVNFEQSTECIQQAWLVFGAGTLTPTINQIFLDDIGAVQGAIAADYPNVTYVPSVWGTLQAAGGISGAPTILVPSPAQYMSDCIHPNHNGYLLVHGALYEGYWGRPAPTATIAGQGAVCVGATVRLRDASSGADTRRWSVDGADAGDAEELTLVVDTPGPRTVALRVDAGAWDDSTSVVVTGQSPPNVSLTGPEAVVAGVLATYRAEGTATAYAWSIEGGAIESTNGAEASVRWGGAGSGTVQVVATGALGCEGVATRVVSIHAATCGDGLPEGAPCDDGDPCTESLCTMGVCAPIGVTEGCCENDADCEVPFETCATRDRGCVPVLCAPCERDADCGPEGNLCLDLPSGPACGADCTATEVGCPTDFVCADLGEGIRQCVPLAGDCDCAPDFTRVCRDGVIVWFDSCGHPGEALMDCDERGCIDGGCCPQGTAARGGVCVELAADAGTPEPDIFRPAADARAEADAPAGAGGGGGRDTGEHGEGVSGPALGPTGPGEASSGCASGPESVPSVAWPILALLALLLMRRRNSAQGTTR